MKQKNSENELTTAQVGWETLDNLGDNFLDGTVTGLASDVFSSVPFGTVVVGVYKGYRAYKNKKKFENFVEFIKSYKKNTDKEINQYLKNHPTSEVGEYTLTLIEELSSLRQTDMLGKATALLLNQEINEDEFYEYGYIITKLDPHLYSLVLDLNNYCFIDIQGREDLKKKLSLGPKRKNDIVNPNQDLLSFGFLDANTIYIGGAGQAELPQQTYTVNFKYKKFYDRIIG